MINFVLDDEVKSRIDRVVSDLGLDYIDTSRIFCIKSNGSKGSYIHARCHKLPRIVQKALSIPAYYIIEVIGERYDSLSDQGKDRLIGEVLTSYIPKRTVTAVRPRKGVINFFDDVEVKSKVDSVVNTLGWKHIDTSRVICLKSKGTKGRFVRARCWSLSRIWQQVLGLAPYYIIEMMGEYYDRLDDAGKYKFIIHELLHIPNGFTGGLRAHKGVHGGYVNERIVNDWYNKFSSNSGFSFE